MASRNAAVAEAIKARLNAAPGATFVQAFTAQRKYLPASDLEDLDGLTVTVVATRDDPSQLDRLKLQHEVEVQIGVQKRLSPDIDPESEAGNDELDAHVEVVEQIADYLSKNSEPGKPNITYGSARWTKTSIPMLADPEHLADRRVMTSLIILTLKIL
jgi:hypothetical protein